MLKDKNILELRNIDKHFGGVYALKQVNLSINKGEVHAIVGENGAGKSTLMKILAGTYQPDMGAIILNGKEISFNNPHDAHSVGINIIYQEFFAFPPLTVVQNVFAGREISGSFLLNEMEMRRRVCDVFNKIGVNIDLDATVGKLSVADQQIIEIAKALVYEGQIIIMDEPNSALTDRETRALFEIIKKLKNQGITILYISHRLEEVFQICDRISVLRDGNYMGTWERNKTNIPFIISQMIGRTLGESFPEVVPINQKKEPILVVKNLTKDKFLDDINFKVRPGEVLGFAGLEGSGIRELFQVLFGITTANYGEISFDGDLKNIKFSSDAIKAGWGLIPANRRDHGLLMKWSIKNNIALVILKKLLMFFGLLNEKNVEKTADEFIAKLKIATDTADKIVFDLSGGNQQKVVIAKWLATHPKLLILDDPTRGIDVGAKSEIYYLIHDLAEQGLTILFSSSEIDEVLGLSHRILVMRQGKIIKELLHKDFIKAELLRYVSGDIKEIHNPEFSPQECI